MENRVTTHVTKGLIIALILIVLSMTGQLTKLALENWFGMVNGAVMLVSIIVATIFYGKQMQNNVTWSNLFAHGFKTAAVVTCIVFIFMLLSVYVVNPHYIDLLVAKGVEQARIQGKIPDENVLQQNMGMAKKITTIILLAGTVMGNLIIGVAGSLLGAIIAKKNPVQASPFQ